MTLQSGFFFLDGPVDKVSTRRPLDRSQLGLRKSSLAVSCTGLSRGLEAAVAP
jgi:hypothetical protein